MREVCWNFEEIKQWSPLFGSDSEKLTFGYDDTKKEFKNDDIIYNDIKWVTKSNGIPENYDTIIEDDIAEEIKQKIKEIRLNKQDEDDDQPLYIDKANLILNPNVMNKTQTPHLNTLFAKDNIKEKCVD
jgi:hypothetical protein